MSRIAPMAALGLALALSAPALGDADLARRSALAHLDREVLRAAAIPSLRAAFDGIHAHRGQRFARFSFTMDGLPVFFCRATVQVEPDGRIRRAVIDPLPTAGIPAPHPLPTADLGRRWAAAHGYTVQSVQGNGWLVRPDGALVPVIRVDTEEEDGLGPLALFLHARTGVVLAAEPLSFEVENWGAVFPENPATTPDVALVPLQHLDPRTDHLFGAYAHVLSCVDTEKCEETTPRATWSTSPLWGFVYEPDLKEFSFDDPFAEVNAYHNITTVSIWLRERFGWDGLFAGESWITVRVGRAYYNASYYVGNDKIPPMITFGQDVVDFAYDADVAYHEFGHALDRSRWEHSWMAKDAYGTDVALSGIEEGLADAWAELLSGDPVMNSYIPRSRTADNDLSCPQDLEAEGHMEARILSGMVWDVVETAGRDAVAEVAYRALQSLPTDLDFPGFAEAVATAAEDLAAEGVLADGLDIATVIRERADRRGLFARECVNRIVPLPEGETRRAYGYGRKRNGGHDLPFGLQWVVTAPAGAAAVRIFVEWLRPTETADGKPIEPGFTVHLRRKEPVAVTWRDPETLAENEPAFDVQADLTVEGAPADVAYPPLDLPLLEADEQVYVLLSSATDESVFVVAARAYFTEIQPLPANADAGAGADSRAASALGRDGAASCATTAPGCSAPDVFAFLVGAALERAF